MFQNDVVHHDAFSARVRGSTRTLSCPVIQDQLRWASHRHQTAVRRVKKRLSRDCHALDSTTTKAKLSQCDRRMYMNTGCRWGTRNLAVTREKGRHPEPLHLTSVSTSRSRRRMYKHRVVYAAEVVSAHANTWALQESKVLKDDDAECQRGPLTQHDMVYT